MRLVCTRTRVGQWPGSCASIPTAASPDCVPALAVNPLASRHPPPSTLPPRAAAISATAVCAPQVALRVAPLHTPAAAAGAVLATVTAAAAFAPQYEHMRDFV
jgi:hypothetical protein